MNANSCYAGTHGPKQAPVVPSLLAGQMLHGIRSTSPGRDDQDERHSTGHTAWHTGSCGGPCVSNELIGKAFGHEG